MISKRIYSSMLPYTWVHYYYSHNSRAECFRQDIPSDTELVFIVLNFVACVPVLLLVGGFR